MQVGEIEQDGGERQTNVKGRVVERDHEYLTWNNIDVFLCTLQDIFYIAVMKKPPTECRICIYCQTAVPSRQLFR